MVRELLRGDSCIRPIQPRPGQHDDPGVGRIGQHLDGLGSDYRSNTVKDFIQRFMAQRALVDCLNVSWLEDRDQGFLR